MVQTASRKRPAPGTSPISQQVPLPSAYSSADPVKPLADQFLQWNRENAPPDLSSYPNLNENFDSNAYPAMPSQTIQNEPSNQLARRPLGHQVLTRGGYTNGNNDAWPTITSPTRQSPAERWDDEKLNQQAAMAMSAAKAARKSIPPFVQKLSR